MTSTTNALSRADEYQKKSADDLNKSIVDAIGTEEYYSDQLRDAIATEVQTPFMILKSRVIMVSRIVMTCPSSQLSQARGKSGRDIPLTIHPLLNIFLMNDPVSTSTDGHPQYFVIPRDSFASRLRRYKFPLRWAAFQEKLEKKGVSIKTTAADKLDKTEDTGSLVSAKTMVKYMLAVHRHFEWYFHHVELPPSKDLNGAFSYDPTDQTHPSKFDAYIKKMELFFSKLFGNTALRQLVDPCSLPKILYQKRWDMLLNLNESLVSLLSSPTDSARIIPSDELSGPFLNTKKNQDYLSPFGDWLRSLWKNLNSPNGIKAFTSLSLEHCHETVFSHEKFYTYFLPMLVTSSFVVPLKKSLGNGLDSVCPLDDANVVHGTVLFPYTDTVLSMLRKYQSCVTANYDIEILHGTNGKVRLSTTSEQCGKFTLSVPHNFEDVSHLLCQWNVDQCVIHQGCHNTLPVNIRQSFASLDHDYLYSADNLDDDKKKNEFNTKIFGDQHQSYEEVFDQITTSFRTHRSSESSTTHTVKERRLIVNCGPSNDQFAWDLQPRSAELVTFSNATILFEKTSNFSLANLLLKYHTTCTFESIICLGAIASSSVLFWNALRTLNETGILAGNLYLPVTRDLMAFFVENPEEVNSVKLNARLLGDVELSDMCNHNHADHSAEAPILLNHIRGRNFKKYRMREISSWEMFEDIAEKAKRESGFGNYFDDDAELDTEFGWVVFKKSASDACSFSFDTPWAIYAGKKRSNSPTDPNKVDPSSVPQAHYGDPIVPVAVATPVSPKASKRNGPDRKTPQKPKRMKKAVNQACFTNTSVKIHRGIGLQFSLKKPAQSQYRHDSLREVYIELEDPPIKFPRFAPGDEVFVSLDGTFQNGKRDDIQKFGTVTGYGQCFLANKENSPAYYVRFGDKTVEPVLCPYESVHPFDTNKTCKFNTLSDILSLNKDDPSKKTTKKNK